MPLRISAASETISLNQRCKNQRGRYTTEILPAYVCALRQSESRLSAPTILHVGPFRRTADTSGKLRQSHHISAVTVKRPSWDLFPKNTLSPVEAKASQEPDLKPCSLRTRQAKAAVNKDKKNMPPNHSYYRHNTANSGKQ